MVVSYFVFFYIFRLVKYGILNIVGVMLYEFIEWMIGGEEKVERGEYE